MSIANEEYVSLVTYKADGTPKALPVWIVDLGDNTVGFTTCLLYTSPSPRDKRQSRMPSSA